MPAHLLVFLCAQIGVSTEGLEQLFREVIQFEQKG